MLDYEERKTIDRDQFRLVHYAGTVTYTITGTSSLTLSLLYFNPLPPSV